MTATNETGGRNAKNCGKITAPNGMTALEKKEAKKMRSYESRKV